VQVLALVKGSAFNAYPCGELLALARPFLVLLVLVRFRP
jgi:hypothetical protein